MAFTPIILTLILILDKKFLYRISKLLSTKVIVFFIVGLMCFCVRQVIVGQAKHYWAWMIGYLFFALIILLYTRKNKGYDNATSFRLAVYSIWALAFLKELVWYILFGVSWFSSIINAAIFGIGEWWIILGFHISCIISTVIFFLILVQLGWRPSKKWIILFSTCFLFSLFVFEPLFRDQVLRLSVLGSLHRLPWIGIMLLAVIESPKEKNR